MEFNFDVATLLSPPDIMASKRILCIQPHPDDNEVGMGGTIAALAKRGCEIHYLTVTNGDKGNLDKSVTQEETAVIRREEAQKAGRLLGATEFHFLEYDDATLSDVLGLSIKMAETINKIKPNVVFCPDPWLPYEGHYDHIITGRAAANAFQMSGVPAIGYYFTAWPNTVIDITYTFGQKIEAIATHKSQFDNQTIAMYKFYFEMKGRELAQGKDFEIGEGFKVLSQLHSH